MICTVSRNEPSPPHPRPAGPTEPVVVSVLLAMSEPLVTQAMAALVERDPRFRVGMRMSASKALADAEPRVLLMDARRPPIDAEALVRVPGLRGVVALSERDQRVGVTVQAMLDGVRWRAVSWACPWRQLAECLQSLAGVEAPPHLGGGPGGPTDWQALRARLASLSARERQVLRLIAEGYSVRAIADLLHLAESTIDNHKSRLMKKLDVRKSVELARLAYRMGVAMP